MSRKLFLSVLVGIAVGCADGPASPKPTTLSLSLSQAQASVARNSSLTLSASAQSTTGGTTDVTSQAAWSSSNETVATVSAGVVTVKALGIAQISASFDGRQATATITGRRRTHFDGSFAVFDVNGGQSLGGLSVFLNSTQVAAQGGSGFTPQAFVTVRGSSGDKPIEPGTHELAIEVGAKSGSHLLSAGPFEVTVSDTDTREVLAQLGLVAQQATLQDRGRFKWTINVPSFTQ